jgi:hypothetical protein
MKKHPAPLLPIELRESLPSDVHALESNLSELTVYVRYVHSLRPWTWYVLSFDGEDTFLGVIVLSDESALGNFTLSELKALTTCRSGEIVSLIHRDVEFVPISLEQLSKTEPALTQFLPDAGQDLVQIQGR